MIRTGAAKDDHQTLSAVRDPQPTISRRQWIRLGISAAAVVGLLIAIPGRKGWFDIGVYHDAVTYWVQRPGRLYDFIRPGTPYGFTYPPFAAVCMLPMSLLGWHTTIAINVVITVIASAFLLYTLVDPIARRAGWNRWYAFAVATCLFALIEPVRDTIGYGQINLVLVALVYLDLVLLNSTTNARSFAGVGVGLAAAIKLTPAVFILYLVITRRWRAAAVSITTMVFSTAFAAIVAPGATLTYFTQAVWDTGRIGDSSYVSNQSLMGLVARLRPAHPDRALWLGLVVIVLVVWAQRVRAAALVPDDRIGFALTGIAACLISPITWVHHLVWLIPALVEAASAALPLRGERRRRLLRHVIVGYVLLCSDIIWLWWKHDDGPIGFLGSNLYVFLSLILLIRLPIAPTSQSRSHFRLPSQSVRTLSSDS